MLQVFQNKNFALYFWGGLISRTGDILSGLAFLFLAQEMTHSTLAATGVVIAETAPYLLFGLVGGVVADWVNKRRLLVWIDTLRASIMLSVFVVHQFGMLSYWHLIVAGFVIQSFGCFFNPAHRAVLPLIVSESERIAANGLIDSAVRGATVTSPLLTVFLLKFTSPAGFFAIDAVTYVCSAVFLFLLQVKENSPAGRRENKKNVLFEIRESLVGFLKWTGTEKTIRRLFVTTFLIVLFNTWVWEVGLFLQLKHTYPNGEVWYSTLQGWFGGIVILVNIVIPFLFKRLTIRTYLYGSFIWGLGILALGFADRLPIFFASVLIAGLGQPLAGLSRVSLLQQFVPEDKMGRGFSVNATLLYLANVISLWIFGLLAEQVPIPALMAANGILMILTSLVYLYLTRKVPGDIPYVRRNSWL